MKVTLKWFFIVFSAGLSLAVVFSPLAEKKSKRLRASASFSSDVWRDFNTGMFADSKAPSPKKQDSSSKLLTKRELIGEDYDAPIPSSVIKNEVGVYLDSIVSLCSVKDLNRQAGLLQASLDSIQSTADKYIDKLGLQMEDSILLRGMRYMLHKDQLSFGRPITADLLQTEDIRLSFELAYRLQYALPEDDPIEKHLEDWAKKIYRGLDCVYGNL